jgi:DNA mismatch endonuclease (patch repair protein)
MPDVFTKAKRSDVMSRIRSRGNRDTELALVRLLRAHGITGWRRQVEIRGRAALLRGPNVAAAQQRRPTFRVRPDFVFRQVRLALFVDGCFWHGCPKHGTKPKGNAAFWRKKFAANRARDRRVNRALRRAGWRVVRIWEHELRQGGILLRARLRRTRRQPAGLKNLQPSTFNLQPRSHAGRGTPAVIRRIQRAIAARECLARE